MRVHVMVNYFFEFGRLHPVLVHFPIGVLIVAFILELFTLRGNRAEFRTAIRWLVLMGAGTSVLAVGVGLLLAYGASYPASTLSVHQWTGIATAAIALVVAWLVQRADRSGRRRDLGLFRAALGLNVLIVVFAGHFGASLTHGEDYLLTLLPWNYEPPPSGEEYRPLLLSVAEHRSLGPLAEPQLNELSMHVRRIFARRCLECHGEIEQEGGLRLDSEEGVREGGDNGSIIVPSRPDESEIMRRLRLPSGHEDKMPQEGRPLIREEIEVIRIWRRARLGLRRRSTFSPRPNWPFTSRRLRRRVRDSSTRSTAFPTHTSSSTTSAGQRRWTIERSFDGRTWM